MTMPLVILNAETKIDATSHAPGDTDNSGNSHPMSFSAKLFIVTALFLGLFSEAASGQESIWFVGTGNWSADNSWLGGVPNGQAAEAGIFNVPGRGQAKANLDMSPTVNIFVLGDTGVGANNAQLRMNGGETLTVDGAAQIFGTIVSTAGQNTIDLPHSSQFTLEDTMSAAAPWGKLEVTPGTSLRIKGDIINYHAASQTLSGGWYDLKGMPGLKATLQIDDIGPSKVNRGKIELTGDWSFESSTKADVVQYLEVNGGQTPQGQTLPGILMLHDHAKLSLQAPGNVFNQGLKNYSLVTVDKTCTLELGGAYSQQKPARGKDKDTATIVNGDLNMGVRPAILGGGVPSADFISGFWGGDGNINRVSLLNNKAKGKPGFFPPLGGSNQVTSGPVSLLQLRQPTSLTINGNYQQEFPGILEIDVNSSLYGQLIVNGTADLSGNLVVDLLDGSVPNEGDTYVILTATQSLTGYFQNAAPGSRIGLSNGGTMVVNYNLSWQGASTVTLSNYEPPL